MHRTQIQYDSFAMEQLQTADHQQRLQPHRPGALHIRQGESRTPLEISDWGERIEISTPYSTVMLRPEQPPVGIDADSHDLWGGGALLWLLEVQRLLNARSPSARSIDVQADRPQGRQRTALASRSRRHEAHGAVRRTGQHGAAATAVAVSA